MVVKQGIAVTSAGRGALNAAYSGLGQLSGMVFPLFIASLFKFFQSGSGPWWLQWGPGGHFIVTSATMCLAWGVMASTDPSILFIDDQRE